MSTELLDVYDENMQKIGVMERDKVHKTGAWHCSFHCWIVRRTNDGQFVLFQKRGPEKELFPNFLDISVAGHLSSGESPKDGIRELREELGIRSSFAELKPLGVRCEVVNMNGLINREFCFTYLLENNLPLEKYRIQEEEVSGLVQMSVENGLNLFSGELPWVQVWGFLLTKGTSRDLKAFSVSAKDVIPRPGGYYTSVFIMAERYLQGLKYLGI